MMMRRSRPAALAAAILLVALPRTTHAADPAAAAKTVAPYLDAGTVAVARLDLAAIDVDAALDRFAKAAGINPDQLADPRRAVREGLAAFRKAGATDVLAVFSVADLPNPGPFLLV